MTDIEIAAELAHHFICSTCGAEVQTGIKPHHAPTNGSGKLHSLTVKAKDLRRGDTIRPTFAMMYTRIVDLFTHEENDEVFEVVATANGLGFVFKEDEDIAVILRETWR